MSTIFPIVEGHGEVEAVPLLLRKILHERLNLFDIKIAQPYRMPRSKISKFGPDLLKAIKLGHLKLSAEDTNGMILILADADDDCPSDMHEKFTQFLGLNEFGHLVSFVLANREYEAWLIACGESMRGHQSVRPDAPSHPNPESIRGAKEYFEKEILLENTSYSETVDQVKFSAQIHLEIVYEKCRSFRKLVSELEKII
ncbi:DUF4276 family protein [Martelella mangrovi]|uniref:DUF4276 family protein n=1 Tax=Martelella mangrovi TaxID=1397477 RepID=A0ABV2IH97_9HYPH